MLSSCTADEDASEKVKKAKKHVSIQKKQYPKVTKKKKLELCDILRVGDFVKVLEMFETRGMMFNHRSI